MSYDVPPDITCQEMTPPGPRMYRLGDLLHDFEEDAQAAREAYETGQARGPVSRFPALDEAIGGAFAPGLHMLHGGPGTGKTALALQIAATCGAPALFVSCEMPPLELLRRLAARVTNTFLGRFKTGELLPREAVSLALRACEASPTLAIADGLAGFPKPEWIQERAAEVKGTARHFLLVIDSLHSWAHGAGADDSEYDALNAALSSLGRLAGALQCPALVIVEENRATLNRPGQRGMHSGAGTRRIEYTGETVFGMDCEDENPDMAGEKRITARIEKNRHGQAGTEVPLLFHGALQRFREGG